MKNLPVLLKKGEWRRGSKVFNSNGKDYLALTPDKIKHFKKFRIVLDDPLTPRTGPIKQEVPEVEEYSPEPVGKLEDLGGATEVDAPVDTPADSTIEALKARFMTYPYKSLDSFADRLGMDQDYIRAIGASWLAEKAAKQAAKVK